MIARELKSFLATVNPDSPIVIGVAVLGEDNQTHIMCSDIVRSFTTLGENGRILVLVPQHEIVNNPKETKILNKSESKLLFDI